MPVIFNCGSLIFSYCVMLTGILVFCTAVITITICPFYLHFNNVLSLDIYISLIYTFVFSIIFFHVCLNTSFKTIVFQNDNQTSLFTLDSRCMACTYGCVIE